MQAKNHGWEREKNHFTLLVIDKNNNCCYFFFFLVILREINWTMNSGKEKHYKWKLGGNMIWDISKNLGDGGVVQVKVRRVIWDIGENSEGN